MQDNIITFGKSIKLLIGIIACNIFAVSYAENSNASANLLKNIPYLIHLKTPTNDSSIYRDNKDKPLLTDGKTQGTWKESVKWNGTGTITITFKFPAPVVPTILRCHMIGGTAGSIFFPNKIMVYGENNYKSKQLIGMTQNHPFEKGWAILANWMIVDIEGQEAYNTVSVDIIPNRKGTMIDEIEMYSSVSPDISPAAKPERKNNNDQSRLFQTDPALYSAKDLYSFYPKELIPISNYKIGMCYLGGTMSDWTPEMHMQKIREFGFNTVHAEGQSAWGGLRWGSINYAQGRYDWRALDRFVQNAADAGLYAVLCQDAVGGAAPPWIFRTYPDAAFINPYGETVPGVVDYGHPEVLKAITDFLAAVAKRYKNCPNIASYIIADEMSAYQNYYHTKNLCGQNFNPRMCREFQKYLEEKYKTIESFNQSTEKPYPAFKDVIPCLKWITGNSYGREWTEWCRFREIESARIYRAMYDAIKKEDPNRDIILSAVYLGWAGAHVGQGVNLAGHGFFDTYAEKMYLSDIPGGPTTIPFWLANVAGILKNKKAVISNMAWNLPKKTGTAGNNSADVYVRGLFEALGANADNILYWAWEGKEKRKVESVYNYAMYIYPEGSKYRTTSECETLKNAIPFFSRYGNILAQTYPGQASIGGLHPLLSFYHATRNILASRISKDKYPRGEFSSSTYQMNALKSFMVKNNYNFWIFPSPYAKDEFAKYKIISLVGNNCLSAQDEENAKKHLDAGAALIIDKNTGCYAEDGKKQQNSLAERLQTHKDRIYIFDTDPKAKNEGFSDFLERNGAEKKINIKPAEAAIGTQMLRIDKNGIKGTVIVLINRGEFGSRHENVDIEIKKDILPEKPFYTYVVNPYPVMEEKKISGSGENIFKLSVGTLEYAKVIFILDKPGEEALALLSAAQIQPRYKRVPWWNDDWICRVPITCYERTDDISFNIDLDNTCKKIGLQKVPALSSLRLIRDCGSTNKLIPISVNRDPDKKNSVNISFRDEIIEKTLPAKTYYLYLNERDVPDENCCRIFDEQWFMIQKDGISIIQSASASGKPMEGTRTLNKFIVKNIPDNKNGTRVFMNAVSDVPGKYTSKINGQAITKEITDYERAIYLCDIKENAIKIEGDALEQIQIRALILAPGNLPLEKIYETADSFRQNTENTDIGLPELLGR